MVFALEPKIVLPGIGPVGIENSWVVTNERIEKLIETVEQAVEKAKKIKEKTYGNRIGSGR